MSFNSSRCHFYNRENFRSDTAFELNLKEWDSEDPYFWHDFEGDDLDYYWGDWWMDLDCFYERELDERILNMFDFEAFGEFNYREKMSYSIIREKKGRKKFIFTIDAD
jgi:hypothetical protein